MASSAERPAARAAAEPSPARGSAPREDTGRRRGGPRGRTVRLVLLALIGAASGLSTLVEGFYDAPAWGPIAIGLLGLVVGLVAAGVGRPRLIPGLAVGGLAFLWLWSRLSTSWAESADQAVEHAGRWAMYAAALLALLLLMRRRNDRWIPLAFAGAGILAVGLYVAVKMAFGDGASMFFGGRLRDPLGYVNGQAGFFLLGFWPCVALAEQRRHRLLAGAGAGGAVVVVALLVLSQARGVIPALVASAAVVLALVPGRARRVWVLAAVGAGALAMSGALLDVYRVAAPEGLGAEPDTVARAGKFVLVVAALVAVGWAVLGLALSRGARSIKPDLRRRLAVGEGIAAAAALVVTIAVAWIAIGDPVDKVRQGYDDFVNLQVESTSDTRFLSGGGYRYDYWRVAWLEFEDAPVRGVGAGNYDVRYFAERRTNEDIRQPHSLELQVLAELGVIGALGLLAFLGAVYVGLWRTARRGRGSASRRALAVGAGGAFTAWLAHTSVDWLHVLPGVTGVAICAAAGLVAPWSHRAPGRAFGAARIISAAAVAVVALAAADSIGRFAVADRYRVEARDTLTADPIESLRLANRALALNDGSVPAHVIKSAAYARVGDYEQARDTLRAASALEPSDPLPWMLLGDLAVRRGDIPAARRAYERALELNPRDGLLPSLAEDPRAALPEGG